MPEKLQVDYCLEIDFKKGTECPSRVFRTLHETIDALQLIDKHLIGSIDVRIEPVLLLEDIEGGSVKTWLATSLQAVPDDAIYHLDWKPIVGSLLLKGKYNLINFLVGPPTIPNVAQIKPLEKEKGL